MNISYIKDLSENGIHQFREINFHTAAWEVVILVVAIVMMSYLINFLLANSILGKNYRIFVAPGVILHELAHLILCLLAGAKVRKVSLFDKDGGSVEHEKPKIPVIGQFLISLAPFVLGIVLVYFLIHILGLKPFTFDLFKLSPSLLLGFSKELLSSLKVRNYQDWLILYLIISVTVTMLPSKQDLKNIWLSLIFIPIMILLVARYTDLIAKLTFIPIDKAVIALGTVAILLIFILIFSMIILALSKMKRA